MGTGGHTPTPSQTVGPFFGFALPFADGPNAIEPDSRLAIRVEGQVFDGAGEPVIDALLEISSGEQFARCGTDAEGSFHFTVSKPAATSGAPHLDVTVFARGLLRYLRTRLYFPDEAEANAVDAVLLLVEPRRRGTLIARSAGAVLHHNIHLQGPQETVFFN